MRTLLVLPLLVCLAVPSVSCRGPAEPQKAAAGAGLYACPMHPAVVKDRPGECPICGMDLVRMKDRAAAGAAGAAHVEGAPMREGGAPGAADIAVSAGQQKILGVAVSEVGASAGTRPLRLVGRVTADETRVYRINAGVEGSIRDLSPATSGSRVRKDEVLGSYWAPNALSPIQQFITALPRPGQPEATNPAVMQQKIMQLENLGMSAAQREEIAKTGKVPDTIQIRAPADGFVLARNVSVGQKFNRGDELYRIADLRRVWVLADVFQQDARHVRPGMAAQVSVPELGRAFQAKVTQVLPQFDAASRTLKVRIELDNPDLALRPDMFVEAALAVELPQGLTIPADAIVDSGLAKTVFVQTGEGTFEPRRVETGWRSGDRVQVVSGLAAGEKIVTSGTFFLDSETRLRSTSSGAAAAASPAPVPTVREDRPPGGAGSVPDKAPVHHHPGMKHDGAGQGAPAPAPMKHEGMTHGATSAEPMKHEGASPAAAPMDHGGHAEAAPASAGDAR